MRNAGTELSAPQLVRPTQSTRSTQLTPTYPALNAMRAVALVSERRMADRLPRAAHLRAYNETLRRLHWNLLRH